MATFKFRLALETNIVYFEQDALITTVPRVSTIVLNEEDRDNCSFKGKTSKRLLKDEEDEDGKRCRCTDRLSLYLGSKQENYHLSSRALARSFIKTPSKR